MPDDCIILPWFIQAARQSLSPDFVTLNENSHARVNVQYSGIRPKGPPLWLPVRVAAIQSTLQT